MESRSFKQRIVEKKSLCWYIFGILFTILYSMVIFGLFDYDFQVPLWYQDADNLNALMFLKRTKDGFFVTDMQGAPFYAVNDFPLYGDTLNLLIQKVLLDITGSIGMTVNLFYLGLYPVTFCTSFYVMRKCEVVNWAAFVSSILYTFLPYRLLRSTKHLYLSNYCFIPILVYICILIYTKPSQKISKHDLIFFALMVPCLALCGIYYAFISCFLIFLIFCIAVSGQYTALRKQNYTMINLESTDSKQTTHPSSNGRVVSGYLKIKHLLRASIYVFRYLLQDSIIFCWFSFFWI